VLLVLTGCES